jgi:glucokinase
MLYDISSIYAIQRMLCCGMLIYMYITVDVGATKTLIALFDNSGQILKQTKHATNADAELFKAELITQIKELWIDEIKSICIAVPALIDHTSGKALRFNNLAWDNVDFITPLSEAFNRPIYIENDAKAAALAEAQNLKGKYQTVLYITVSTGIGVGIVYNNKLAPVLIDSEPGSVHFMFEGKLTAWEDFASGRAIKERYKKFARDIDPSDKKTWGEIASNLSRGFEHLIATIQPDVVVVGGSIGAYFDRYKEQLINELKLIKPKLVDLPPIIQADHPEEAVVYGCYLIARDHD